MKIKLLKFKSTHTHTHRTAPPPLTRSCRNTWAPPRSIYTPCRLNRLYTLTTVEYKKARARAYYIRKFEGKYRPAPTPRKRTHSCPPSFVSTSLITTMQTANAGIAPAPALLPVPGPTQQHPFFLSGAGPFS